MKNRTDKEFIRVFQYLHGHLTTIVLKPNCMQIYNEASPSFQALLKDKCIGYQLPPPGMHRRNAAEWAIHTFKYHFITGV